MSDDIRNARIIESADESFDSSADLAWALAGDFADRVGRMSITEHGEYEFAIVWFEPMGASDNAINKRVFASFAEVHFLAHMIEPACFDRRLSHFTSPNHIFVRFLLDKAQNCVHNRVN